MSQQEFCSRDFGLEPVSSEGVVHKAVLSGTKFSRTLHRTKVSGSILLLSTLGLLSATGVFLGRKWLTPSSSGPLSIQHEALDFGTAWTQDSFRWVVPIRNDGDEPITFELRSSCDCTIIDEPLISLGPGQSHQVDLAMDLSVGRLDNKMGMAMRPFQVSLTAVPKAGSAHVQQWLVSGLVKLPFLVIPSHYDLNREIPRGHKIEDAVFTVRCFEPISDITINSDSGALATDVRRVSADNFEVRLTFADRFTKAIGKITTRIRVSARGAKGAIFEPQLVTLSGAVVGPLKVTPDHFHFGLQNIGTDVEGKFVIRSRRDEFFRLVRIDGTFGKGDLTFEPVQRPFEYRRELEVPFQERIRHPGDREDAVDFLLELKDTREQFQERALVRYHGVESKGGG